MVGLRRVLPRLDQPGRNAVLLSTIHRAKGMEADRVFLLEPLLLPHPRATRTWEKEQEENLRYIALTRALSLGRIRETASEKLWSPETRENYRVGTAF